jgi:hypothetical protein
MTGYSFLFRAAESRPPQGAEQARTASPGLTLGYDTGDETARVLAERAVLNARDAGIALQLAGGDGAADARLRRVRLPSLDPQTALDGLVSESPSTGPVTFTCRCSRERVEGMLSVLGAGELEALLAQEGQAEETCRFCGDRYVLTEEEVRALIDALRRGGRDAVV